MYDQLYSICVLCLFKFTDDVRSGNALVFGKGLFATTGAEHRRQRKVLNPVFSTTHMRDMSEYDSAVGGRRAHAYNTVPLFYDVAHKVIFDRQKLEGGRLI